MPTAPCGLTRPWSAWGLRSWCLSFLVFVGELGKVGVVLAEGGVVVVGRRCGLGSFGQESGWDLGHGVVLSRLGWRVLVADELVIGIKAEPGGQRPLQGVAEVLKCASGRLEAGPLPPSQGQATSGGGDDQRDQRWSPTPCSGHRSTVPRYSWDAHARVAELADARVLGTRVFGRGGSSPPSRTISGDVFFQELSTIDDSPRKAHALERPVSPPFGPDIRSAPPRTAIASARTAAR